MSDRYPEGGFSLPVGGAKVDEAAAWLAARPPHQRPHPIVPELRKLFGLTTSEACAAIREAGRMRSP